ncbi:hypothetical protein KS4_19840 [Poriferisphaera corsica]|uniref:Uncharacterized protein n=1 Tax=Poriferisphaera corsica TaxID=2528020 RepID=A0A517YUM4_9BACT|nr:hypothetical protein KS4_19840 [Poriferisphaera corsica]
MNNATTVNLQQSKPDEFQKIQTAYEEANRAYSRFVARKTSESEQLDQIAPFFAKKTVSALIEIPMVFTGFFFIPIAIILRSTPNRDLPHASPWPATCERCGYNIFTSKTPSQSCSECGQVISQSIPANLSQNKRTGSPLQKAFPNTLSLFTIFKYPIRFLAALIKNIINPIIKPSRFGYSLKLHDGSCHHQYIAYLTAFAIALTSLAVMVTLSILQYSVIYPGKMVYDLATDENVTTYFSAVEIARFTIPSALIVGLLAWIAAVVLYQLITLVIAIYYRLLHSQKTLYHAHRVISNTYPALILLLMPAILWSLWVIFEITFSEYRYFFRTDWFFGDYSIDEEIVGLISIVMPLLPALIYYLFINMRIIKHVRFANA